MVDKAPATDEDLAEALRDPKIKDFDALLEDLARQIVGKAALLGKAQFDLKLDAFKAATAYKAVKNREQAPGEDSILVEIRQALDSDAPEPAPEPPEAPESDQPEEPDEQ